MGGPRGGGGTQTDARDYDNTIPVNYGRWVGKV